MGLLNKFKGYDTTKRYQAGIQNESVFSRDKNYTLVEVITLLKYQAYKKWGSNEALDILLLIASFRESLIADNKLNKITDKETFRKEMRNVDVQLGKVLRNFEILCEQYSLPNPLTSLEGYDALLEIKKLVKLDKEFYGSETATPITEEIYRRKSKELGSEFLTDDVIYPLANIQLYDTMILLMLEVVKYDSKELSSQIQEHMFSLRNLVSSRKAFEIKLKSNNGQATIKDLSDIQNLFLQMGEIKAFFDGIADESNIPNKLYYDISAESFWKKLSCMFDVLNSMPTVIDNKNTKKEDLKKETSVENTEIVK